DPKRRLAIVENARKTLAEWPQNHFNYRHAEVRQMLSMLDEAIADLRAAAGGDRFNLSFVALGEPPPPTERILPNPTPGEATESVLAAARATDSGAERKALLNAAMTALDRDAAALPLDWAVAVRTSTTATIQKELRIDRTYAAMIHRMIAQAESR